MEEIRFSTVSGDLYPLDPGELEVEITATLEQIEEVPTELMSKSKSELRALVVPHSGYKVAKGIYGTAYGLLDTDIDEAFVVGNSLFHNIEDTAFANYKYWQTPLGKVEQSPRVDEMTSSDDTKQFNILNVSNDAHHGEHAIEVQLPYLQVAADDVKVIPISVSQSLSPRLLSQAMHSNIGTKDVVVVPAELSQSSSDKEIESIDEKTISEILKLDTDFLMSEHAECTNKVGVSFLMELSKVLSWKPYLVRYDDVIDDKNSDLKKGLAAIAFYAR